MQLNLKEKVKNCILDTSALIALLKQEPGYELISEVISSSYISAVNLSEFITVLTRSGVSEEDIDEIITNLASEIIPFCQNICIKTGKLAKLTNEYGLSLGDRACISTAEHYNMTIYTADKIWADLKPHINSKIIVIR